MIGDGTREIAFERAIERDLLESGGYTKGETSDFDAELALIPKELFAFIEASQPALWAKFKKEHGASLESGLLDALTKTLATRGCVDVLRHGFKFYGALVQAAVFKPAHSLNPDVAVQYRANRLVVTRQVKFNPSGGDSVDVMLSLNGLPIATLELKNSLTGQTAAHAQRQYKHDRDPKLPLFQFKKRALVHFAVDTDEVWMTTRLSGRATHFLPFNRGREGGAGNPTVEGETYKTAYLWQEVLERESLLDILARFVHLVRTEEVVAGKKVEKETMVFPRYHQLDAVRRLEATARAEGPGRNYLIQHSAGSGKTNTIAWLAHRLSSVHDAKDEKVFDSVVVISDRRVLDKQLQDNVYQFEHKQGVVQRIDQHSDQLAEALKKGVPIVITTLQKFPFVAEKIGELPSRNYALIVDEAHSSLSGEAVTTLKGTLGVGREDASGVSDGEAPPYGAADTQDPEEETWEDELTRTMSTRGRQPNMSFFAFTATPKAKTLEVFGRPGAEGKPLPFHLYSMRQAIEEKFILDVLRNYTTYRAYYRLVQTAASADPDVKKQEATAALARFMSLHPHNIAQKTEVIVEHFRAIVQRKLQGKAKAMVVTRSRLHAVRFKRAFDAYIREKGYGDLKALVAFSGTVVDPEGGEYTEVGMNAGIKETELKDRFATDEFQVLLVANKYQTGFDQPLLCAMYVDKRLAGVQAVQTLSRLNRSSPGKEDTFVLDFVNEPEEIYGSFQPYYEQTTVAEVADPHQLEVLQHELDKAQIWTESELMAFARVFYRPKANLTEREHEEVHRHLQPAVDRYTAWTDEEEREAWKAKVIAFTRLYAFLSQIMPWTDQDLEIRYTFARFLLKRLPRTERGRVDLDGEVDLHSYRLARIGETDIKLEKKGIGEVAGPTETGTGKSKDEEVPLHEIVQSLNERFGTEFTSSDQLLFEQVIEDCKADAQMQARAHANSFANFSIAAKAAVENRMIDRMDRNQSIVTKYLNEDEFKEAVSEYLAKRIYEDLKKKAG